MELYRGKWSDKEYLAESEIIYEEKNNLKKIYYIFDVNSICDSRQHHVYSLCTGGNLCQTAKYFLSASHRRKPAGRRSMEPIIFIIQKAE